MGTSDTPESEPLTGGWQTEVHRVGNHIRRRANPWSPAVIALLTHLADVGFAAAPRPVGDGFDKDGHELLTYVEGESPHPGPWSDEAIHRLGELVRRFHWATESFVAPRDPTWQHWFGRDLAPTDQFGHGDLAPWNIMAVDGLPVGVIDWDTAGPFDHGWELAQVAWLNVQLHDDDVAERVGLGDANYRANQLRLLLDGYGLTAPERVGFVERVAAYATHDAANEAITHRVGPETTTGVAADGYPFAWGMAWRARSASWILRNKRLLEHAIERFQT